MSQICGPTLTSKGSSNLLLIITVNSCAKNELVKKEINTNSLFVTAAEVVFAETHNHTSFTNSTIYKYHNFVL